MKTSPIWSCFNNVSDELRTVDVQYRAYVRREVTGQLEVLLAPLTSDICPWPCGNLTDLTVSFTEF